MHFGLGIIMYSDVVSLQCSVVGNKRLDWTEGQSHAAPNAAQNAAKVISPRMIEISRLNVGTYFLHTACMQKSTVEC